jgi:hypothetical protein
MRSDIRPGGTFPDYALPDRTNTVRKLSELQCDDPLVLTLARGNYCPKDHRQHLELTAKYSKVTVAYGVIAHFASGEPIRYATAAPLVGTTGDIQAVSLWAGQSVALTRQPQPAAKIVDELVSGL